MTQRADISQRRRHARRTAVLLGGVALLFYLAFIAMGVLNA